MQRLGTRSPLPFPLNFLLFAILAALALVPAEGVAGNRELLPPAAKAEDLVWPLPPEKPRLRFLRMYTHNFDVEPKKKKGFFDRMIGAADPNQIEPFNRSANVAADSQGRIFIASPQNGRVWIIDKEQKKVTRLYGDSLRGVRFRNPVGLAIDSQDNFYISDSYHNFVAKFDKSGRAIAQLTGFQRPTFLALDEPRKRLFVVDVLRHQVLVYDTATLKQIAAIGQRGEKKGEFNFPEGVAVDTADGTIAVADMGSCSVQLFDANFKFIRRFGSQGVNPGHFVRPKGVAFDREGFVWVVDASFNNVQIFDKTGRVLLFIGGYGDRPGFFDLPMGIFIDKHQRVYVGDSLNGRVQVFQFLGGK